MRSLFATFKVALIAWTAAAAAIKRRDEAGKPRIFDPDHQVPLPVFLERALHDALVAYDGRPPEESKPA